MDGLWIDSVCFQMDIDGLWLNIDNVQADFGSLRLVNAGVSQFKKGTPSSSEEGAALHSMHVQGTILRNPMR